MTTTPKPYTNLRTISISIERKIVKMELNENERGRYVRIIEEAAGRRNIIVIPAIGLSQMQAALASLDAEPKSKKHES